MDEQFRQRMQGSFTASATGCLAIPTLEAALNRISTLESRLAKLEAALAEMSSNSG